MKILSLPFAGALLLVSGVAVAQTVSEESLIKEAKRLSAAEVQDLHAGKTVYHENTKTGFKLPIWYAADGMRAFKAGNRQFSGAWQVKDDKRCEETLGGPVVCMTFYKKGDDVHACDPREAPDCRWIIRRSVAGDAEGLGKQ